LVILHFENETVGTHLSSVFVVRLAGRTCLNQVKIRIFAVGRERIYLRLEEELQNADSLLDAMPCIGGFGEEKSD